MYIEICISAIKSMLRNVSDVIKEEGKESIHRAILPEKMHVPPRCFVLLARREKLTGSSLISVCNTINQTVRGFLGVRGRNCVLRKFKVPPDVAGAFNSGPLTFLWEFLCVDLLFKRKAFFMA